MAFFTFGVAFYLSMHDEGRMDFHYKNEKDIILVGREESSETETEYIVKDGRITINAQNIRVAGILENETIQDDNRIVLINAMKNPGIREAALR